MSPLPKVKHITIGSGLQTVIKNQIYIMPNPDILIEEDILVEDLIDSGEVAHLIVFNDDYNTFEWVIESFIKVCKHGEQQAEQLAMIIHLKGKATVKTATMNVLRPMKDALIDRGLSAHIETVEV